MWIAPSTITLSLTRPPISTPQGLANQRQFAVIGHLTASSSSPSWDILSFGAPCHVSEPLAQRFLSQLGLTFISVENTTAVIAAVKATPSAIGLIPFQALNPEIRLLGSPFPIQEWVAWKRSEGMLAEWLGVNTVLDHLIQRVSRQVVIELPPVAMTLVAVGDVMLGRGVQKRSQTTSDPLYPFTKVAERLRRSHVTLGNLECAITLTGTPAKKPYVFRADQDAAKRLKEVGFTVISMANNHGGDFGREGLLNSLIHLSEAGIGVLGAGPNHEGASAPWITTLPDGTVVGIIGSSIIGSSYPVGRVNPGVHVCTSNRFLEEIKTAKSQCDFLTVFPHWGEEYTASPTESQRTMAHKAIDAGADAVIGHHPHWIQEVEFYKGGLIVYSLGNFVFDQFQTEQTTEGLIFTGLISKGRLIQAYFDPVAIVHGAPEPFPLPPHPPALINRLTRIQKTLFPPPVNQEPPEKRLAKTP